MIFCQRRHLHNTLASNRFKGKGIIFFVWQRCGWCISRRTFLSILQGAFSKVLLAFHIFHEIIGKTDQPTWLIGEQLFSIVKKEVTCLIWPINQWNAATLTIIALAISSVVFMDSQRATNTFSSITSFFEMQKQNSAALSPGWHGHAANYLLLCYFGNK